MEGIGLLIVAIGMLGLVNAITMSIIERTREIGVLRCIGTIVLAVLVVIAPLRRAIRLHPGEAIRYN